MKPMPRPTLYVLLALLAGVAALPQFADVYHMQLVTRIMILGIFAMSLDLLIGFTGLVSFGHAAFFGLSGYMLAIISPEYESASIWWALPACLGATALFAMATGWLAIRTSGIYFIMITLAFAQMLYFFFFDNPDLGGSDGVFIYFKPTVKIGETTLLNLDDRTTYFYFVLAWLLAAYAFLWVILRSPFGRAIIGIRANEHRMRALGFATQRYKLVSFMIAGSLAGLAGFLEASHGGYMSPSHMSWQESGIVLMIVIMGGMGTLYGAVIGAFVLVLLQDWLGDLTQHWHLAMGLIVIGIVLFMPNGIAGLLEKLTKPRMIHDRPDAAEDRP